MKIKIMAILLSAFFLSVLACFAARKNRNSVYENTESSISSAYENDDGTPNMLSLAEKTTEEMIEKMTEEMTEETTEEATKEATEETAKETTDMNKNENIPATANELVYDMGNGWNLGNTMEAVGDWCEYSPKGFETCWGQPVTTNAMIAGVKECGFDSVRVPVAWSNMISKDGNYTIDEAYFNRVDEIVGYVLDNDMYCMINIHWDGGWWEGFGDKDQEVREETMKRYNAMWTQIANHYKDFSPKLIFESANEELGQFTNHITVNESYELVNKINQSFVDIVRKSGGNNRERFLLIAGYNTDIVKTCSEKYIMPKDTIEDHLLISVHYYTPSTFCIAGETTNSWGYMDSWGTDQDKAEMRNYFEKMKKFSDQGYGVIIGEYGVTKKKSGDEWIYKKGTEDFYGEVVKLCDEFNFCPTLWDTGDSYSKKDCKFAYTPLEDIYSK